MGAPKLTKGDVRFETFRAGGKGGQHQNKTETGVRARWHDENLNLMFVAESRETRSQERNKELALARLQEKVDAAYNARIEAVKASYRQDAPTIGFGAERRVRTYNEKTDTVTNHASGAKFSFRQTVGKDDVEEMIDELAMFMALQEKDQT